MRKKDEQPIKSIIQKMMDTYQIKDKFSEANVKNSWRKVMGNTIADRTNKIYVKKGTLYLHINSSSLKQELSFAKTKIIEMINKELGETFVKEVIIF